VFARNRPKHIRWCSLLNQPERIHNTYAAENTSRPEKDVGQMSPTDATHTTRKK